MNPETESTGRLKQALKPELRSLVYQTGNAEKRLHEYEQYALLDRVQILMLLKQKMISIESAKAHLKRIAELEQDNYESLLSAPLPRGSYIAWEKALEIDGHSGAIHLGRSRNDINATLAKLNIRQLAGKLIVIGSQLIRSLQQQGKNFSEIVMAGYTHGQPAMTLTFGHTLYGWAIAATRELMDILSALDESESECPLGAGAQGGTELPIDPEYTAKLLGFNGCSANSLDAVGNRSFALKMLSAVARLGLAINRFCEDLMFYSSPQINYIRFDDDLCGASSMMPQKRNPFLCEIVSARMNVASGALVSAQTMFRGTGYTNTAIAGEAMEQIYNGLRAALDGIQLFNALISGIKPNSENMLKTAQDYYTCATPLANYLVRTAGYTFREAHRCVGEWVCRAEEEKVSLAQIFKRECQNLGIPWNADVVMPERVWKTANFGGGPGIVSMVKQKVFIESMIQNLNSRFQVHENRWKTASELCFSLCQKIIVN